MSHRRERTRTDEPPSRTFLTARYFVQFSSGEERSSLAGRSSRPRTVLEFGDLGAQRPFGVAAFGDLTHDRRYPDDLAGVVAQQRDTELDRQPLPVAVGGWHAKELVAVAGVSGGHRLEVALPVPLPQLLRDDHVQALPHHLSSGKTKDARGSVVPQHDDP